MAQPTVTRRPPLAAAAARAVAALLVVLLQKPMAGLEDEVNGLPN